MTSKWFAIYGKMCATYPWEVIVIVITLTTCFFTVERTTISVPLSPPPSPSPPTPTSNKQHCTGGCYEDQYRAIDVVIMTIIRCLAILYTLHQFRTLQKHGSKYILGLAGLFVVFSSFLFTSTLLNVLQIDLVDLKDAMFFFLLLIDLSKAVTLTQFALTASTQEEVSAKIARGMSILGPRMTLNTLVEALVIGVGTLSGVRRLELLSYFACFSVIVNYLIFMTFYPACLALMLELSRVSNYYGDKRAAVSHTLMNENEKAINPAVQRVKIIMSIGLTFVHVQSRWFLRDESKHKIIGGVHYDVDVNGESDGCVNDTSFYGYVMTQFALSADHLVILILLVTLIVKFIYFENTPALRSYSNYESNCGATTKSILSKNDSVNSEKEVQTIDDELIPSATPTVLLNLDAKNGAESGTSRTLEECLQIYRERSSAASLSDTEVMRLVYTKHIPAYALENALSSAERGVLIRRKIIAEQCCAADHNDHPHHYSPLTHLPYREYDYGRVLGSCCENVIGYVPIPVGVAGPLKLDAKIYHVPMATTEGCLVASTNRGCRAVESGTGVRSRILSDGMSRGPAVRFTSITRACDAQRWLEQAENFAKIKREFDSTSRFARLQSIKCRLAGRVLYVRFVASTGDAMGMNMVSKGTEKALIYMQQCESFEDMEILSLSGNFCADKKPASVNWIEGRGKSVVCEAVIPADTVRKILKTTTQNLCDLNTAKNIVGSAVAGSVGGFNAHAANIVTAIFIATGQDPAQNVTSSNCITLMEPWGESGEDLYVSCTMPSLEVGTVGGGTVLPAQAACLDMLGVRGANTTQPGDNAKQLARIVCATVLVGEVSLMAALAAGHLVRSHLKYNRISNAPKVAGGGGDENRSTSPTTKGAGGDCGAVEL